MVQSGVATVYVSDLARAVEFYTLTLGMTLQVHIPNRWAQVNAASGFSIGLHPRSAEGPSPGAAGSISIGLTVTMPIEKAVEELTRRGVKFRGAIRADGPVKLAFFGDPDGNALYLSSIGQGAGKA